MLLVKCLSSLTPHLNGNRVGGVKNPDARDPTFDPNFKTHIRTIGGCSRLSRVEPLLLFKCFPCPTGAILNEMYHHVIV